MNATRWQTYTEYCQNERLSEGSYDSAQYYSLAFDRGEIGAEEAIAGYVRVTGLSRSIAREALGLPRE